MNVPLSPVENISVWCFMLVPLDCLCLVPQPDGLQTHLHVSSGSLSPLVDKFLSTELLFPWAGPSGRRTGLQESESSWGRGLAWAGAPSRAGWGEQGHLCCSALVCNTHPRAPDSGMTQVLFRKSSSRANCCHLCPVSPAVSPRGSAGAGKGSPWETPTTSCLTRGRQAVR